MQKLILLLSIALYSCHSEKVPDEFLGRWKRINPKSTHHKTLDVNNEYLSISDNEGNVMIQNTFDSMIEKKEPPFLFTAIFFKESNTLTLTYPGGPPFSPPGKRMEIDKKTGILDTSFSGRYIKIK